MHTRATATAYITDAIDAGDASAADVDTEGLADRLYTLAGGSWDFDGIDTSVFWAAVQDYELFPIEVDEEVFFVEIDGEMVEQQRIIVTGGEVGDDVVVTVVPSTDADDYAAALRAQGWVQVGEATARRANNSDEA